MKIAYTLCYMKKYLIMERNPNDELATRNDGRKVVREGTLWSRLSDYGLRDYHMLSSFLTEDQYLDVLIAVDAYTERTELYLLENPPVAPAPRNPRFDVEKPIFDMAEAIFYGRRQPPKRGTPSSRSGRLRVVGECRHKKFDEGGPRACFKCGIPMPEVSSCLDS